MSISYKLFGMPKTFDEFVDKIQRKGLKSIDIYSNGYIGIKVLSYFEYCYYINLKSNNLKFISDRFKDSAWIGSPRYILLCKTNLQLKILERALQHADTLEKSNLEVTIEGKPISESREGINAHIQYLEDIKNKIEECPSTIF